MTKTANVMMRRQIMISALTFIMFFCFAGVYEWRLRQIDEKYQEVVHTIYRDGITVKDEWPKVDLD